MDGHKINSDQTIHPSVHFCPLIQGQLADATGPGVKARHPSPQQHSPAAPGVSQAQKGYLIPPASPGSAAGPPPSRMCLENLQRRRPGGILTRTTSAESFPCGGAAALLQSNQTGVMTTARIRP